MRAVIQRVQKASVLVGNRTVGAIGPGMLVLVGVGSADTLEDARYIADKIVNLRVFEDMNAKMNLDIREVGGEVLLVSQFTLYGDARKGRRPSYSTAAAPELAQPLFETVVERVRSSVATVKTGEFGAHMMVQLVNDGPVTLLLDSSRVF